MELGALEVQIFVSLALVLGAVFVAFLCDFLKGKNESLRERNIELAVRQEEREKQQAAATAAPPAATQTPAPVSATAPPVFNAPPPVAVPQVNREETPAVAETPAPVVEDPAPDEWASSEELAEVDAVSERIVANTASAAPPPPSFAPVPEAEWDAEEAIPESGEALPVTKETISVAEEAEAVIEEAPPEADEPSAASDIIVEPETTVASPVPDSEEPLEEMLDESAVTEAAEEIVTGSSERDSAEEAIAPDEPEPEAGPGEPQFSVQAKVTPIDVIAAERNAANEALKLARELERIAELSDSEELQQAVAEGSEAEPDQPAPAASIGEPSAEPQAEVSSPVVQTNAEYFWEESAAPDDEEIEQPEPVTPVKDDEEGPLASEPLETAPPSTAGAVKVPTGFQDYSVLGEAIESDALFKGTTVSIAAGVSNGGIKNDTLKSVGEFVESLLTPSDFGCQSSEDEFLLILPDELGAPAQRRLQYISQRLWDYQIRTVESQTIMFSWGAYESSGDPLREAISAAQERMMQTRRNRERASSEIHSYRRMAAND